MRDLFLSEIKNNNIYIRENSSSKDTEKGIRILFDTINKITELSKTARIEGLLALEEAAEKLEDLPGGNYLKNMILLIVDGTDPELLADICTYKYYAEGLKGYEAIQYIMMMDGCLSIQAGENPIIIEVKLASMLSDKIASQYFVEKEEAKARENTVTYEDRVKEICSKNIPIENRDESLFRIRILEYAITILSDGGIQRLLKDVDSSDLAVVMKALKGNVKKKIFNNVSERFGLILADDIETMGPVRLYDVGISCNTIYNTLLKLIKRGEIACREADILLALDEILSDDNSQPSGYSDSSMLTQAEISDLLSKI